MILFDDTNYRNPKSHSSRQITDFITNVTDLAFECIVQVKECVNLYW